MTYNSDTPVPITVTGEEIAAACEALRYMASDMSTVATAYRAREVNALRRLATELEESYIQAAMMSAANILLAGE